MSGLRKAMTDILQQLTPAAEACFDIRTKLMEKQNCFSFTLSYFCDKRCSRNISAVEYDMSLI